MTDEMTEIKIGMYSEEAAKLYGTHIYSTPSGGLMEVCSVDSKYPEGYNWPDAQNCGPVDKWIRKGRTGSKERDS